MKDYYWIVSVLFKTGEKVSGLKTAVIAGGLYEAVQIAGAEAAEYKTRSAADEYFMTDIGITDDNMVPPEGWWPDPIAEPEDWPK